MMVEPREYPGQCQEERHEIEGCQHVRGFARGRWSFPNLPARLPAVSRPAAVLYAILTAGRTNRSRSFSSSSPSIGALEHSGGPAFAPRVLTGSTAERVRRWL